MKFYPFYIFIFLYSGLSQAQSESPDYIYIKERVVRMENTNAGAIAIHSENGNYYFNGEAIEKDTSVYAVFDLKELSEDSLLDDLENRDAKVNTFWSAAFGSKKLQYVLDDQNRLFIVMDTGIRKFNLPSIDNSFSINSVRFSEPYLFISTVERGLLIWDERDYSSRFYSVADGLSTSNVQDAIIDLWGNLWIANESRIYRYQDFIDTDVNAPLLKIVSVNINEEPVKHDLNLIFEGESDLLIEINAITLSKNTEIKNEYRLKNTDAWIPLDKEFLSVNNLGVSNYSIQFRSTTDDVYYDYSDKINLQIKEGIWNKTTIGLVLGLVFIVGLWLLSLLFQRRKSKAYQVQRDRYLLENQLLKTEKKALQMQMNPHFMFNSLNAIQGLISLEENQKATKYIQDFSKMLRSMLHQSRSDLISVEDEIDYLKRYLSMERLANNEKFEFEVTRDKRLDDDLEIPNMIVQPFIENAIKHAFSKRKDGQITVSFKPFGKHIICTVDDNGNGRKKVSNTSNHKSLGISVVKERLGRYHKNDERSFIDFFDKEIDGLSAGTKVEIILPIMS